MSQISMIFANCGEEGIRTLGAETTHTLSKRALSTTQTPHHITRYSLEQKKLCLRVPWILLNPLNAHLFASSPLRHLTINNKITRF